MSYTEVTERGWFSRIGDSIKGILVGIVLVAVSCIALWWGEGRAVHRAQALTAGREGCVPASAAKVDAANEGKLVHVQGKATTTETLTDPQFMVSLNALRLRRSCEMYQWKQKKETKKEKKLGGGEKEVTVYTYSKDWDDELHNSSEYKEKGHDNPGSMKADKASFAAKAVTLGAFDLNETIVQKINKWEKIPATDAELQKLDPSLKAQTKIEGGMFYVGPGSNGKPEIGDTRVTIEVVKPTDVTLVYKQTGKTFEPMPMANSETIELLATSLKSKDEMFADAESENAMMTWIIRVVGFFMMWIGFSMLFAPLSVLADIIPFVGDLVGFGTGMFAFLLASFSSLVVVAFAWIFYRPVIGGSMLGLAVLILFMARGGAKKKG